MEKCCQEKCCLDNVIVTGSWICCEDFLESFGVFGSFQEFYYRQIKLKILKNSLLYSRIAGISPDFKRKQVGLTPESKSNFKCILVPKNFGLKKSVASINFSSKKILGPKKVFVPKFGSKKFLVHKNLSQKIVDRKTIWVKKIFWSNKIWV